MLATTGVYTASKRRLQTAFFQNSLQIFASYCFFKNSNISNRFNAKADVKSWRSVFYWFFRSRADLLAALLDHWQATNTGPLLRAIEAAVDAGPTGIHILGRIWIEERDFNPVYDTAVRDWARKDAKVAAVVREVDDKRIAALTRLMQVYGYKGQEALVRARIMYFHQVGYYALGIHESEPDRYKLEPIYMKALTGWDV